MRTSHKRPYKSLQDWMERTGTSQTKLAALSGLTQSHLSYILTGGKRCSLVKAIILSNITGVPVQKLIDWKGAVPRSKFERGFNPPPAARSKPAVQRKRRKTLLGEQSEERRQVT